MEFLTEYEKSILESNQRRLSNMVDKLFEDGAPEIRHMRIAKEIIETSNSSMLKQAEIRQKQNDTDVAGKGVELGKSILDAILNNRGGGGNNVKRARELLELPNKFIPDTIEGETDFLPRHLNVDDFVKGDE